MTQQFKFGDRVNHWRYGIGIVVHCEKNIAEVVFSDLSYRNAVDVENIRLIPHPDTARLDYIQKNFSEIRVCEDEYERFFTLHEDGEDWLKIGRVNVRELIDMAIAEQSE